jgi:hypothetical protein
MFIAQYYEDVNSLLSDLQIQHNASQKPHQLARKGAQQLGLA